MRQTMIAPVGKRSEAIFVAVRDYRIEKVILLAAPGMQNEAASIAKDLDRFKIEHELKNIAGPSLNDYFQAIAEARNAGQELIVNVSAGDAMSSLAALSAAFVNGIKAIAVSDDAVIPLPVLNYSYYQMLTGKKLVIMKLLAEKPLRLEELGKKTKMSLPLISYHLNGNLRSQGLLQLGLIERTKDNGRKEVRLSSLGTLLIKGYSLQ